MDSNYANKQTYTSADLVRLKRDVKTLMVMAEMYCHDHKHIKPEKEALCPKCSDLIEYAITRTYSCPRQHKTTCDTCTIRCYKPNKQRAIREIMAYSGPRMIFRHPLMAIRHLAKKFKQKEIT